MATQKLQKLILGPGGINTSSVQSQFYCTNALPTSGDGNDGDVWVADLGANSDILFKTNGAWSSLIGAPQSTVLSISQSGFATTALSYTASAFKFMTIEYSLQRAGSLEVGVMRIVTDGGAVSMSQSGITTVGTACGIDFSPVINGANVELRYNSDAGSNITMKYVLKGGN